MTGIRFIVPVFTVLALASILTFPLTGLDNSPIDYSDAKLEGERGDCSEYSKTDGIRILKCKNKEVVMYPDGSKTIWYKDGTREIVRSSGKKIKFKSDGSVLYRSKDGTDKEYSMEGITPYGLKIEEVRRVLKRRNFVVELIYSKEYSDDVMDKNFKHFYDELEKQVERWMYAHRVPRDRMELVISNCRFCVTGYCRRKNNPGVEIIAFKAGKKISSVTISRKEIIVKKKHKETAAGAVERIFGK